MIKSTCASALAIVFVSLALGGCGARGPEASFAAAKAHLAKDDYAAAVIELKNALQAKPDFNEARFLLGSVFLEREDPISAAVELRKAVDLGHPADQVVPLLAKAYVQTGELKKVLELDVAPPLQSGDAVAALKTQMAYAYAGLGDPALAEAALAKALDAAPDHASALQLRARLLASKGDIEGAMRLVDDLLARLPSETDALMLKSDLLMAKGNTDASLAVLRKVLEIRPGHLNAHAGLLKHSLGKLDYKTAEGQLEALKKARPHHPQTRYFEARFAAQRGDMAAADEAVKRLLKDGNQNPQLLQLAGGIAFEKGELEQAEQHFGKLMQMVPQAAGPRHMYARVALRRGDPARALSVLQPLLDSSNVDALTLSLAGATRMQTGAMKQAEELFARAVKLEPGNSRTRTALALTQIAKGDTAGIDQLEAIAGSEATETADMALISAHLNRRNFDAALKAVDRLVTKQAGVPAPLHLRGQVLAARGDFAAARESFEKALAADSRYFPSIEGLAGLDLRDNKLDAARARIEAAVKSSPKNAQALLALAELDERGEKPKAEVAAGIAKAVTAEPGNARLRVRLVNYHLGKRDVKAALSAAQDAMTVLPNEPLVLDALARAQLAAGESQQALSTYNKLAALQPNAVAPLLGAARVHFAEKDTTAAMQSIRKALGTAPDDESANRMAVSLMLSSGQSDQALALARGLASRRPELSLGDELVGQVERQRGHWKEAVAAYQAALRKRSSSALAQQLHETLLAGGSAPQAGAFAQSWLKDHPRDVGFLVRLAIAASAAKDFPAAEARNREALAIMPDNAVALNNLAWALHQMKKPGALSHAERANVLAPELPAIMETLAVLLADGGQTAKAIELQQRAVAREPDTPAFRLTLAKLYLQAGNRERGREELERLRAMGDRFADQATVEQLLAGR